VRRIRSPDAAVAACGRRPQPARDGPRRRPAARRPRRSSGAGDRVAPLTRRAVLGACLAAALAACSSRGGGAADLILTHAAIWTGDAAVPAADAIAIIGERIVDVGSAAAIERWRG